VNGEATVLASALATTARRSTANHMPLRVTSETMEPSLPCKM
jgi:hypothetical protein